MRIGSLRHYVTLRTYTKSRDAYGAEVETWEDFASTWASVEPLIGREYLAAKQVSAEVTHKIRMRYMPGVLPTMTIVWGDREFEIVSVLNVEERGREILIMATEDV